MRTQKKSGPGSGKPFGLKDALKEFKASAAEEMAVIKEILGESTSATRELITMFGGYLNK